MEPTTTTTNQPIFQQSATTQLGIVKQPSCLPVARINHITRVVRDLAKSVYFYHEVVGFRQIRRPDNLEAENEGAWLIRDGMAIHLIQGNALQRSSEINICSDHISFQPSGSLAEIEACLKSHNVAYRMQYVTEGGFTVPQVFFHDPDNNMIEICPCDCLPLIPVCPLHEEYFNNNNNKSQQKDDRATSSPADCSEMSEASAGNMLLLYSYSDE
jgi:catechol 2,3-dioxygenase-like lactoylglutathione lyase family enzyme